MAARHGSSASGASGATVAPESSPSLRSLRLFVATVLLAKGQREILQEGIQKQYPEGRKRTKTYSLNEVHTRFFTFRGWGLLAPAPSRVACASSPGALSEASAGLSWAALERRLRRPCSPSLFSSSSTRWEGATWKGPSSLLEEIGRAHV